VLFFKTITTTKIRQSISVLNPEIAMYLKAKIQRIWKAIQNRRRTLATIGLFFVISASIYPILRSSSGWRSWTGFGEYTNPKGEYQRAKTLWDWMQLLIVPGVLAVGVWYLNKSHEDRESALALDQQRQTMFEAYLDKMTDLIIDKRLRHSQSGDEIRTIARARTLNALQSMDEVRKGQILKFLYEANLITIDSSLIDFTNANLRGIHLAWADIRKIALSGSDLTEADLKWTHFENANLANTKMVHGNLKGAYLRGANLQKSNLAWANLQEANLTGANLGETHLEGAILLGAILTNVNLVGSRYNQQTQWSEGFNPSALGAINVDIEKDKAEFTG
jgi:uncharacterized protein YjbI with pentapeptide repeats